MVQVRESIVLDLSRYMLTVKALLTTVVVFFGCSRPIPVDDCNLLVTLMYCTQSGDFRLLAIPTVQ